MKRLLLWTAIGALCLSGLTQAQNFSRLPPLPPGKTGAPLDLSGYWVSLITEDWRFRMVAAPSGDHPDIRLNPAGDKIAAAWSKNADNTPQKRCLRFGAAMLMRVPTRLHITWRDDMTLLVQTDAGDQTRVFDFTANPPAATADASLQGISKASWDAIPPTKGGGMKVVTTHLSPAYLQRNGVPYSDKTSVTEYFDVLKEPDGMELLVVKTIVEDPVYLAAPYITTSHFLKQSDSRGWNPQPCSDLPP